MDSWQKATYKRLKEFAGEVPSASSPDAPKLQLIISEAYCLVKALDALEKYENGELIDGSSSSTS